jgi:hypothetical protein
MGKSVSRPTVDSADSSAPFRDSRCGPVPSRWIRAKEKFRLLPFLRNHGRAAEFPSGLSAKL